MVREQLRHIAVGGPQSEEDKANLYEVSASELDDDQGADDDDDDDDDMGAQHEVMDGQPNGDAKGVAADS